jgi:hypothetical protein
VVEHLCFYRPFDSRVSACLYKQEHGLHIDVPLYSASAYNTCQTKASWIDTLTRIPT